MSSNARIYRQIMEAACATCSAEWFGPGGEGLARRHAAETGHQVQLQIWHRETINAVSELAMPSYAPQVRLSSEELRLSQAAARSRATFFEQPINQRRAR